MTKNRGGADLLDSSHRIYSWLQYTVTVHLSFADHKTQPEKKPAEAGLVTGRQSDQL